MLKHSKEIENKVYTLEDLDNIIKDNGNFLNDEEITMLEEFKKSVQENINPETEVKEEILQAYDFIKNIKQTIKERRMQEKIKSVKGIRINLEMPIECLGFSTLTLNGLRRGGIDSLGDLWGITEKNLKNIRNIGNKSIEEIINTLSKLGLGLDEEVKEESLDPNYFDWNEYNTYNEEGFNSWGIHKVTGTKYDENGYDSEGYYGGRYDRKGFDRRGIHKDTHRRYNQEGFDVKEIHKVTGTRYDENGYDINGYDINGNTLDELKQMQIEERERKRQEKIKSMGIDLEMPIECLDISKRAVNWLIRWGINKLGELWKITEEDLNGFRYIGNKSIEEIINTLSKLGLGLDEEVKEESLDPNYFDWNEYNTYNEEGFNSWGIHKVTGTKYDENGYDSEGYYGGRYDRKGFDRRGIHKDTHRRYNQEGFDVKGIHKATGTRYNENGYDREGHTIDELEKMSIEDLENMLKTSTIGNSEKRKELEKIKKQNLILQIKKALEEGKDLDSKIAEARKNNHEIK